MIEAAFLDDFVVLLVDGQVVVNPACEPAIHRKSVLVFRPNFGISTPGTATAAIAS